jgi:hypothetical protein
VQAFVRGKRAQRPRPHPLRPPGGAAPTAGTPALERHTVISSLVRLTCVISLLIDIGPHVLACSSAEMSNVSHSSTVTGTHSNLGEFLKLQLATLLYERYSDHFLI